jgi:hypothetical protein
LVRHLHAPTRGAGAPIVCVDYVLAGTYTERHDGTAWVVRAAAASAPGRLEPVPAGTAIELRPGDAIVYSLTTLREVANTGQQPLVKISVRLVAPTFPWVATPPQLVSTDLDSGLLTPPYTRDAAPISLGLERVTLAPEATLVPPPPPAFRLAGPAAQERWLDLVRTGTGGVRNRGAAPLDVYVLTLVPTASGTGTPEAATPIA